ncbi:MULTISPECIES: metal ABC transporter substrate-binding protein [unclassified Breznakia]|uniref:metal ABC transporter substrate-binding protein n=1 Tax=unclassified Breznakia TaxID=2623764 RepID=UPI0024745882|nr:MULTISPECIES: metal ABC transporter substrate-binding protein [unclassified Breznakia]MDH6366028.1 zinc transport system substrate-binding protein [Breznakia sp. PH1-1]MDH6403040.1 zinc transport system substrate-binding protein [Breznakia sp. PF1-11]MDH6410749.1 zinc transport system substrate-binding protein [Breznakia sp. PFB1-11]MDH6413194.1 zinc transport system substrate-binding protein [Breznakia sp. PFB1-14]MDH6415562.1 zinc transport system substrate-binding protein [Breznakia sp. 
MKQKIVAILVLGLLLSGCTTSKPTQSNHKVQVVVSSFIGYDLATNIGKDIIDVKNITPWGSELHNFEPTAKDMVQIDEADLFIFLSEELETWTSSSAHKKQSLDLSESFTLVEHDDENDQGVGHVHVAEHDHEDHASLHFWVDPTTYMQLIDAVCERLVEVDKEHQSAYEANAKAYKDEIASLHQEFSNYIYKQVDPTIFFAGHNAMDAFSSRYHINIVSLSEQFKPDADVTAKQLETLKEAIVEYQAKDVFTEELVEPRVATLIKETLQQEHYEIEILELHGYHNISKEQAQKGVTYADLFKQNIENIKQALSN